MFPNLLLVYIVSGSIWSGCDLIISPTWYDNCIIYLSARLPLGMTLEGNSWHFKYHLNLTMVQLAVQIWLL